jgi:RND family efflux transporter MFP subunit
MPRYTLVLLLSLSSLLVACQNKPATDNNAPNAGNSSPAGKSDKGKSDRAARVQSVTTTLTHRESVPQILEAQGNTLPLDEVDVRPQKNGMIVGIHVKEGDEVKRGQLLFSLDSRDDNANVSKSEAAVASTDAAVQIATRDVRRNEELSAKNFIAPSALDTFRNKLDTANALLAQNKAALEQAKVSQSYNRIYAPFDSRVGIISVREGSLVTSTASSPALVHLTRMNPIGVTFAIAEQDIAPLIAAFRKGHVKLTAQTTTHAQLDGELSFIDSSVDKTSGTLLVKGTLDNHDRQVRPGQYVTIRVMAGEIADAIVLPSQAIVNGPSGRFVYVVQEDQTVKPQTVSLVRIVDQKAIVTGVENNVKVVLEGTQNLRPGTKIQEAASDAGKGRGKRGEKTAAGASAPADGKGRAQ